MTKEEYLIRVEEAIENLYTLEKRLEEFLTKEEISELTLNGCIYCQS